MVGVVKFVPVPTGELPITAVYQLIVPADAMAPKVTVPKPHRAPGVVAVIVGVVFTVAVTAVLPVAVHPLSVAST